jgi:hypothetical protein
LKKIRYSPEQVRDAYLAWTRIPTSKEDQRLTAWNLYCDLRDGLPLGTSAKVHAYGDPFLGFAAAGLHDE